jgi:hypothetical protein
MRTRRRLVLSLLSFCVCFAAPAHALAQGRFTGPAEAVARQVIAHMDAMRWNEAAALFHPEAREAFKRTQLQQARGMEQVFQRMAAAPTPGMPAALSEWMARNDSIGRAQGFSFLSMQFAGITRAGQLDSLPSVEVLARWLQARDDRARGIPAITRAAATARSEPVEAPTRTSSVVGGVWENDSTAQVLVRSRLQRPLVPDPGTLSVMSMRRTPAGWRVWTVDGSEAWMGTARAGLPMISGQISQQLEARRDSTLTWRDADGTTVRGAVLGVSAVTHLPRTALLEVRAPDGTLRTLEFPYAALAEVLRYFSPWVTLPALMQGRSPY